MTDSVFVSYAADGVTITGIYTVEQGFPTTQVAAADPAVQALLNPTKPDPLDSWDLISLKVDFNHENRIRAFEGKPAITVAQFKAAIRNMAAPT